jgi:flagellar motility protein MotE (MotC chaperone)
MTNNHDAIQRAIESAIKERDQLLEKLKEFDSIKERLDRLEVFINQGKLLIGEEPEKIDTQKSESTPRRILRLFGEKTNPEKIMEILEASGRAMTVPEISNEFRARNWRLSEKNRMQILRNALKGKPEWFEKEGVGLWNLKWRVT